MKRLLYPAFTLLIVGHSLQAVSAEPAEPATPEAKALREEATQYFAANCTSCHGAKGDGKGPAAAMLSVPPPDFRATKWQKAVTDQHIETIIPLGGPKAGKSSLMPAFPALVERPGLVKELRAFIRELGKPKKR